MQVVCKKFCLSNEKEEEEENQAVLVNLDWVTQQYFVSSLWHELEFVVGFFLITSVERRKQLRHWNWAYELCAKDRQRRKTLKKCVRMWLKEREREWLWMVRRRGLPLLIWRSGCMIVSKGKNNRNGNIKEIKQVKHKKRMKNGKSEVCEWV